MRYKVHILPAASRNIRDAKTYLRRFYVSTVNRFVDGLKSAVAKLRIDPTAGRVYEDNPCYRKLLIGKYFLFYTVDEEKHLVEIQRVLRASWDIPRYLPSYSS
jgi:plasmid stabilization system protein ParE